MGINSHNSSRARTNGPDFNRDHITYYLEMYLQTALEGIIEDIVVEEYAEQSFTKEIAHPTNYPLSGTFISHPTEASYDRYRVNLSVGFRGIMRQLGAIVHMNMEVHTDTLDAFFRNLGGDKLEKPGDKLNAEISRLTNEISKLKAAPKGLDLLDPLRKQINEFQLK